MERERRDDDSDLVRCLDCGTIYKQPADGSDVEACPSCGYVGWIAVSTADSSLERTD